MPRKKLTKAQVKRKLKQAGNAFYELTMDKVGQPDSFVPISIGKLIEMDKAMHTATKRLK